MSQVYSRIFQQYPPLYNSCFEYVHPWKDCCSTAIAGCFLYCIFDSLRIYGTVYLCALMTKGRVPTKKDLQRTLFGILQSTAFLSFTGFGYSLFLCTLRRVLGHFNLLSVSFWPAFLSSVLAILIERPSRRTLLCLYVSNIATETVWNMALSRGLVRNIPYGDVAIFGISMAMLLTYYKGGYQQEVPDSMFKIFRFVVGPDEELGFCKEQSNTIYRQSEIIPPKRNNLYLINEMLKIYKKIIYKVKCLDRHQSCPHSFSCIHYIMGGGTKMFSLGLGIQISLKLVLNIRKLFASPRNFYQIIFRKDILNLGLFLGLFSGLFRGSLCGFRRLFGYDHTNFAFPASVIAAALSFRKYPDTTVALYVMWKAAQISYCIGIKKGCVPKVTGFTEFLYCLSTGILFHAAILEPTNLRPSYWKFLHSISGGRIACMARAPLDVWGLDTTTSLAKVLKATKTIPVVSF